MYLYSILFEGNKLKKNITLIIISLIVTIVFVIVYVLPKKNNNKKQEEEKITILTTTQNLKAYSIVSLNTFIWKKINKKLIKPSYITEDYFKNNFESNDKVMLKTDITAKKAIKRHNLLKIDNNINLSSILKPGMKALPIKLGKRNYFGQNIFPGDIIDVVIPDLTKKTEILKGKTVIVGIRVLSINNKLIDIRRRTERKTVTLEVSPHQAEKLVGYFTKGPIFITLSSQTSKTLNVVKEEKFRNINLIRGSKNTREIKVKE